jgi:hypothetical protein
MRIANVITPLAMILAASVLSAQETSGTLVGTVLSKSGTPVAGATVRIASPKMLLERVAVTNEKGDYRIPLLPTGNYTIHFAAKGYLAVHGTFTMVTGQTLRQNGVLPVETTTGTTVEVTASTATIDKTETVTQTNLNIDTLQNLGLLDGTGAGSIFGLMATAPGVNGNGFEASIRGGVGAGANITMDGATVRSMVKNLWEMRVTVEDMIESMAVIQSPLNAKYGNTDGGSMAITTSRGSNEWSGSIRRTAISRGGTNDFPGGNWGAVGSWAAGDAYANKLGQHTNRVQVLSTNDELAGEWNVTVKGPLWRDHITFAYAGVLKGTTYTSYMRNKSFTDSHQPTDTQSTYYQDPTTGTVIRQAQLSPFDGVLQPQTHVSNWNQYTVFWQINASHQVDVGYTRDYKSDSLENGAWSNANWSALPDGYYAQDRTIVNLGYKGIIGSSGVLEARIAKKVEKYNHPTDDKPGVLTWIGQNNIQDGDTGKLRPANNLIDLWLQGQTPALMENGRSYGDHDTINTYTKSLNYQHMLDWHGQHVIDVGLNDLASKYDNQNVKPMDFTTFGRISTAYPDSAYAGQYIVLPYNMTVSDAVGGGDYTYGSWTVPGSTLLRDASGVYASYIMTQMTKSTGPDGGVMESDNLATYVNDQWTIDQHHSVMAGLRLDHFRVFDKSRTILSYNQLSPRFEYKFDVEGNQKRVFNISYGKFADTLQSFFFYPYSQQYLPYRTTQLWTGAATPSPNTGNPNAPYLVSLADLINPANYTPVQGSIASAELAGGANVSEQLDSHMKAPVATEVTVGFRRNLSNGSYYRLTYIQKSWDNLFDYFPASTGQTQTFPQQYFPGVDPIQVLPRILKNDPSARRTYKSLELEWNFAFTPRLDFSGNLTYSRLMANDSGAVMDNSMDQGKSGTYDRNWYSYLANYLPDSNNRPVSLRKGSGTTMHAWLSYDISVGKLKQSVVLQGDYYPGTPYSNYTTYTIPTPNIPNYTNTVGLPNFIHEYVDGQNRFATSDSWDLNFRYNQEFPIYKKLTWFSIIKVNNVLNSIARAGYALGATAGTDSWDHRGTAGSVFAGGPRIDRDTRAAEGRFGFRTVTFETGMRF